MNEVILKRAVEKWGWESQFNMLIEECAELIKAVRKVDRAGGNVEKMGKALNAFCEEIADVKIMIAQFDTNTFYNSLINKHIELKMARLEKKLGGK